MKFTTSAAFLLLHAVTILAAPATVLTTRDEIAPADGGDTKADTASPAAWRLDCGAPGTTNMCSASNSGAHCDPITGSLTIILEGTCGACKCISAEQCTGRCG